MVKLMRLCCVIPNLGDVTCKATIPVDMEVEAHFLAKEDGIIAGIALAEMVFNEVDPTLKVSTRVTLSFALVWLVEVIKSGSSYVLGFV